LWIFIDESGNPHLRNPDEIFLVVALRVANPRPLEKVVRRAYQKLSPQRQYEARYELKGGLLSEAEQVGLLRSIALVYERTDLDVGLIAFDKASIRSSHEARRKLDEKGRVLHENGVRLVLDHMTLASARENVRIHIDRRDTLTNTFYSKLESSLRKQCCNAGVNVIPSIDFRIKNGTTA
jgi:hypothetical protein